jgi:hypothetical protein
MQCVLHLLAHVMYRPPARDAPTIGKHVSGHAHSSESGSLTVACQNPNPWPRWKLLALFAALAVGSIFLYAVILFTAALLYPSDACPRTLPPCLRAALRARWDVCTYTPDLDDQAPFHVHDRATTAATAITCM